MQPKRAGKIRNRIGTKSTERWQDMQDKKLPKTIMKKVQHRTAETTHT